MVSNNIFLRKQLLTLGVHNMFTSYLNFLHLNKRLLCYSKHIKTLVNLCMLQWCKERSKFSSKKGAYFFNYEKKNESKVFLPWTWNFVQNNLDWTLRKWWKHTKAKQKCCHKFFFWNCAIFNFHQANS